MEKEKEDSPLWKHSTIHHIDSKAKYEMEVTGTHRSAAERLCNEIVRIKTTNSKIVLNSKNYWAQPALIRVVAVSGNIQETQAGDVQPTRQDRMAARNMTQGGTPTRRRRRAPPPASPPATPGTSSSTRRADPDQQQEARSNRRQRREDQLQ
jgi:hypothetical protein